MADNDSGSCLPLTGKGPVRHDAHGTSCGKSAAKGELTMSAQKGGQGGHPTCAHCAHKGGVTWATTMTIPWGGSRRRGEKITKKNLLCRELVGRGWATAADVEGGYVGGRC
jgi:hypothetical protein